MKTRLLIIIGISVLAGVVLLSIFSIEKDNESYVLFCNHWVFSDYKTCKVLWRDQVPEQTQMISSDFVAIPSSGEFLKMDCEDLFMYQEPPNQNVADAWRTRLHECQNGQERLPVLIELERWRQTSCFEILNNTMPEFENVVVSQAFDMRWNQCMEIESEIREKENEN